MIVLHRITYLRDALLRIFTGLTVSALLNRKPSYFFKTNETALKIEWLSYFYVVIRSTNNWKRSNLLIESKIRTLNMQESYMNGSRSQGLTKFQSAWAKTVKFILTPESDIDP